MKQNLKHLLLSASCLMLTASVSAYDFESGGLYYNILPGTTNLEVTHDGGDQMMNQCYRKEEYIIPESVEHEGTTYTVTRIGNGAFNYSSVQFITMPSTLESIGEHVFTYAGSLESITFTGDNAPTMTNRYSLSKYWDMDSYPCLYVPDARFEDYYLSPINSDTWERWIDCFNTDVFRVSEKPLYVNGIKYGNFNEENKECAVIGNSNNWVDTRTILATVERDGVEYTVTSINALSSCNTIVIPSTVSNIEWMIVSASNITIDPENPYFESNSNYIVQLGENDSKTLVWSKYISEIPAGVTAIGTSSLLLDIYVTTFVIPSTVQSISDNMFRENPYNLKYVHCYIENPDCISEYAFNQLSMNNTPIYVADVEAYRNRFAYLNLQFRSLDNLPVEVDGLVYEVTSTAPNTVAVIGCTRTTSFGYMQDGVDIPETVTINDVTYTVTSIADNAFNNIWMSVINIPATVTTIGNNALYCQGCSWLTITSLATVPPTVQESTFENMYLSNFTLYVPEEAVDAYSSHDIWGRINNIRSLNDKPIVAVIDGISYTVTDKDAHLCVINNYSGSSTKVTIPESVTINDVTYTIIRIENYAFNYGTNPTAFIFESSTPVEFGYNDNGMGTKETQALGSNVTSIFVPGDAVDAYKAVWQEYNWGNYSNCVKSADDIITSIDLVDGETIYSNQSQSYDVDITYTRNFKTTAWQALYVPFSLSVEEWNAAGLQIAQINNVHQYDLDEDGTVDKTVLESFVKKTGRTKANTPYLVKADAEGEVTITTNGTLMPAHENSIECSSMSTNYSFRGTYNGVNDMYMNGYYAFDLEGNLCQASSYGVSLGGFRWYVQTMNRGTYDDYGYGMARVITLSVDGEIVSGETTGIANIGNETVRNNVIYGLDGRIVSKDGNEASLPAGIYVKNGKKILVKK